MKKIFPLSLSVALATALSGCGAGGEEEAETSPTSVAVFRGADAVDGLWFQATTGNAYTDGNGGIAYKPGEVYTFFAGNLKLGSFTPTVDNATFTPGSLVVRTDANRADKIINLTRFLLTLDDGSSSKRITISSTMDTAALKWPANMSFTSLASADALDVLEGTTGTAGYPGIQDVKGDPTLAYVSSGDARTHLETGMACAYSGAFAGTRTDGNSRVAFVVDGAGKITALQYFPTGSTVYKYTTAPDFSYLAVLDGNEPETQVTADSGTAKLSYRHSLIYVDKVYIKTVESGTLGGVVEQGFNRLGGKPTATRRFGGIVSTASGNDYVYVLEQGTPNSSSTVSGKIMDLHTGGSVSVSGTFSAAATPDLSVSGKIGSRTIKLSANMSTTLHQLTSVNLRETVSGVNTDEALADVQGCLLN